MTSSTRGHSLTIEEIARTALRLIDDEGLEALTMRGLASDLGVGTMTLYGYVRTKDDVVALACDLAIAALEIPDSGSWHERLTCLFRNLRETLWAHPVLIEREAQRSLTSPNVMRAADWVLAQLRDGGLDDAAAVWGMSALVNYTFGSVMFGITQRGPDRMEYSRGLHSVTEGLPVLSQVAPRLLERGDDREFEFGLDVLVEGLVRRGGATKSVGDSSD